MSDARDRLIELVEDGMLDPMMAVKMCAKWMSNDEVAEMLDANELSDRFNEQEDEDDKDLQMPFPDARDQHLIRQNLDKATGGK